MEPTRPAPDPPLPSPFPSSSSSPLPSSSLPSSSLAPGPSAAVTPSTSSSSAPATPPPLAATGGRGQSRVSESLLGSVQSSGLSLTSSPAVTTSATGTSLFSSFSPPLPGTPVVIADLSVSSASLSSSLSSSSSPPSSEELSSASSAHSSGSSSGTSGSSTQSQQSAHRARAVYAENAYVALLRDIEALSSHVQPPSPMAPNVPPMLTVALSETVQKAQEGWKKITRYRKKTKLKVSRGIERALKKEAGQHDHSSGKIIALKLSAVALDPADGARDRESGRDRIAQMDGSLGGGVVMSGVVSAVGSKGRSLAAKRKSRSSSSPSASAALQSENGEDEADVDGDLDADDKAGDGDDEDSDEKDLPPPSASSTLLSASTVAFPAAGASSTSLGLSGVPVSLVSSSSTAVLPSAYDSQAPVVMSCSKFPIAVLHVPVQRQYTMTRKDSKRIKREEKEALVNVSVRIMGTPDASFLYFVAKDVCQLICLRKGSVAKAIHEFSNLEKARMPVMCQRSSGSGCTQVLTVLTVAGVQRLMNASRQPIAKSVLQWIMEKITEIQLEKKSAANVAAQQAQTTPDMQPQLQPPTPSASLRGPPDGLSSAPQRDDLSRSGAPGMRVPSTLNLSMPTPSALNLSQPSPFPDPSEAFFQTSLNMPARPGGNNAHPGLHSPSQPSFNAPSPGASLLSSQYLTSSNPLSSYGSMHSAPFSSLQGFPTPFGGLQPQPSSRPVGQSQSYPNTPPFTSSSSNTAPHPQQTPQSLQQQNQQLIEALQAHSQSLALRYSNLVPPSVSSPSSHYPHPMALYGGLQQQSMMQPQQPQQQQGQPSYSPFPPHLTQLQPQPQSHPSSHRK